MVSFVAADQSGLLKEIKSFFYKWLQWNREQGGRIPGLEGRDPTGCLTDQVESSSNWFPPGLVKAKNPSWISAWGASSTPLLEDLFRCMWICLNEMKCSLTACLMSPGMSQPIKQSRTNQNLVRCCSVGTRTCSHTALGGTVWTPKLWHRPASNSWPAATTLFLLDHTFARSALQPV